MLIHPARASRQAGRRIQTNDDGLDESTRSEAFLAGFSTGVALSVVGRHVRGGAGHPLSRSAMGRPSRRPKRWQSRVDERGLFPDEKAGGLRPRSCSHSANTDVDGVGEPAHAPAEVRQRAVESRSTTGRCLATTVTGTPRPGQFVRFRGEWLSYSSDTTTSRSRRAQRSMRLTVPLVMD